MGIHPCRGPFASSSGTRTLSNQENILNFLHSSETLGVRTNAGEKTREKVPDLKMELLKEVRGKTGRRQVPEFDIGEPASGESSFKAYGCLPP